MADSFAQPGHSSAQSEGSPASGAGADIDFSALFESTQAELQEAKSTASKTARELQSVRTDAQKANETISKLKSVFDPDSGKAADPYESEKERLNQELDEYINAAMEHDRRGTPIPLTINNAVSNIKFQLRSLEKEKTYEEETKRLREEVKRLSNPGHSIDQTAFSNIDSHVINSLEQIYGPGDEYTDQKNAQFQAVTGQIANEIRDLKENDPQMWDRIRRDRNAQTKLVNHFVKKNIPPKARQIMEQDEIRRTPLGYDELVNAFREAKELAAEGKDPKARQYVTQLRQELLSRVWEKNAGRGGRVKSGDLFQE